MKTKEHNPFTLAILVEEAAHLAAHIDCGVGHEKMSSAQMQLGRWWRGDFSDQDAYHTERRTFLIEMAEVISGVLEASTPPEELDELGDWDVIIGDILHQTIALATAADRYGNMPVLDDVRVAIKDTVTRLGGRRRDIDWAYWSNPERNGWEFLEGNDFPCMGEILDEAEARGWTADNGWESCDDPADDQCDLADANEEDALAYIWNDITEWKPLNG